MHGQNLILQLLRLPAVVEGVGDASKLRLQLCDFGAENNNIGFGRDLLLLSEAVTAPNAWRDLGLFSRYAKWLFQNFGIVNSVKLHRLRLINAGQVQGLCTRAVGKAKRDEKTEAVKRQQLHGNSLINE